MAIRDDDYSPSGWWQASDGRWYPPELNPLRLEARDERQRDGPAPGWWQASDGRWYPPEQSPRDGASTSPPPKESQVGDPILELSAVRAAYGRIEVLHGIDLSVGRGEVLALLGPNGAGKSTLLMVAGGRLRPSAGTVKVAGVEVNRARGADELVKLGVCSIPEGRGVFPNLTVRENLLMWTYQGNTRISEVEEKAYAQFPRLGERRRQLAGTLSGGEQQMLAVARALVGDPKLLLLDEISMGLAPVIVSGLYDVVADLSFKGMTIVLAEQFVQTALTVATRAAIVVGGRIERVGDPESVAAAAAEHYLAGAS